jgi:two-component system vancomycin resistance associated response regulator VraR
MERPLRIAIAEDIDILRRDFSRMLTEDGRFELVVEASNGKQLIERLEEKNVDIIMTDIAMDTPYDGIDSAVQILAKKPDLGILFLTIHDDEETIYKAFSASYNVNYLLKSAEHEQIKNALIELFHNEAIIEPNIARKLKNEFYRLKNNEENLINFYNILSNLTLTEKELIRLLLKNKKVNELADERGVEPGTIKTQIGAMLKKFNMKRSKEVVKLINRLKLEKLFF